MAMQNTEATRQSDLAVMDAQEFKQKRRLKQLLEAHKKVEEKANEAWELFVAGEISHDAKNIMVQRAVKEAIRESYKLLVDHEREQREADQHSEYWAGTTEEPLGRIEQTGGDDIVIYGLADFLQTKEFYREQVVEQTHEPNMPPETQSYTVERSVPEKLSWRAFLRLKEFLDDQHDLEITFETLDDQTPKWSFEDLPEDEVPEDVEVI